MNQDLQFKIRKGFISMGILCILSLQVMVFFAPRGKTLWPFLNYAMYSASRRPGAKITFDELRAVPCDDPTRSLTISFSDLHLMPNVFASMLQSVAAQEISPDGTWPKREELDRLSRFIIKHVPGRYCQAEVWSRTFTTGPHGLENTEAQWERVRSWSLPVASKDPSNNAPLEGS